MVCDSVEGFGFPNFGKSGLIICAAARRMHVDRAKLLVVEGIVAKLSSLRTRQEPTTTGRTM